MDAEFVMVGSKEKRKGSSLPSLTPEHHGTASSILYYSSESHNGIHSN